MFKTNILLIHVFYINNKFGYIILVFFLILIIKFINYINVILNFIY